MRWWKLSLSVAVGIIAGIVILGGICAYVCSEALKEEGQTGQTIYYEETPTGKAHYTIKNVLQDSLTESGKTREKPVPIGSSLRYGDIELAIVGFERRDKIDWWCSAHSGKQYAIATVDIKNVGSPNKTIKYYTYDFRVVGSNAKIYDRESCNTGNLLESGELFGGGVASGDIVCEVDRYDTHLILIWSASLGVSRYFSLE